MPSPGDLPDAGVDPGSPALQADSLPTELSGKPSKKSWQGKLENICSRKKMKRIYQNFLHAAEAAQCS